MEGLVEYLVVRAAIAAIIIFSAAMAFGVFLGWLFL